MCLFSGEHCLFSRKGKGKIMSQDTFNKIITLSLLLYCMSMYLLSWLFVKPIDLEGFLILITPLIAHTIHLVSNKALDANQKVELQSNVNPK